MDRRLLAAALLAAGAFAVVAACDDNPRYVYTARRYDSAKGCLDEYRGVETIPGDDVSIRCKESCLAVADTIYVSPVCPPLPPSATALDDSDPGCQAALDASRMEASCAAQAEEEEADAGGDEDAGEEAGEPDAGQAADAAEEG